MGIVKKQAFFNTVFNYLGQIIGYLNIALLFPAVLTKQEFGLTRIVTSMATVYAQFASFGVQRVALRFFPVFKTEDKYHQGFIALLLAMPAVGFVIVTTLYFVFSEQIIGAQADQAYFSNYYLIVPLTAIFLLYGWVFDNFLRALLKTNVTSFLNNVSLKLMWSACGIGYYFSVFSFDQFILAYFLCYAIIAIISLSYLFWLGHIKIKINTEYFRSRLLKPILNFGSFSVLDNGNAILMQHIDKLMIGMMLNLESVAIYSVASYLATVITVPGQSLGRILVPLVNRLWKQKARIRVQEIYHQSTLLFFILGGTGFLLIWANVSDLWHFINSDYRSGLYVIFFIMLAQLTDLSFGINTDIILASKHYRFNTTSGIILLVLLIIFNYIFIPIYGYTGAAIGVFLAKLIYNLIKFLYLLKVENMQPFNLNNLKALIVLLSVFGATILLPNSAIPLLNIFYKSILIIFALSFLFYKFRISDDLNSVVDSQTLKYLGFLKKPKSS